MSYDIDLVDPVTKEVLQTETPHQLTGGTYAVGGTTCLSLNITYNYSKYFRQYIDEEDGIRSLYGKTAAETIPILKEAIDNLDNDVSDNYWDATEGNAKRALIKLLAIAQLRPDGVWKGD